MIPNPGEPGYNPDRWFQHAVNVGISTARRVGLGLPLVNALRATFADVAIGIIGSIATIIGQGVRAAAAWMAGEPGYLVNPDTLPLAPKGWFGAEEVDRIVGVVDRPGINPLTGDTVYHTDKVTMPEDWSKAAIEEIITEASIIEEDESPLKTWVMDEAKEAHMLWMGKKY
jgi:hypothetical protein